MSSISLCQEAENAVQQLYPIRTALLVCMWHMGRCSSYEQPQRRYRVDAILAYLNQRRSTSSSWPVAAAAASHLKLSTSAELPSSGCCASPTKSDTCAKAQGGYDGQVYINHRAMSGQQSCAAFTNVQQSAAAAARQLHPRNLLLEAWRPGNSLPCTICPVNSCARLAFEADVG